MPNLNYNVPQNVPQENSANQIDVQIVNMIKKDCKISTDKIASALGISSKTVKRHIKDMKIIHYVGRGVNGHWEVVDMIKILFVCHGSLWYSKK